MVDWAADGCVHFGQDPRVDQWARAAAKAAHRVDRSEKRHGGTWFVGVDALPNTKDGAIDGVPLDGPWTSLVTPPATWHRAQLSIVYPGYPQKDTDESETAHRFRRNRDAAHMDGLLPEGSARRRHLREPHGFILGLPLADAADSPLVVWRGSHKIMQAAFARAFDGIDPASWGDVDVTEIYQDARREVFKTCARVALPARMGEATLLHRHLIHGVAPWGDGAAPRPIAYFRPLIAPQDWL